MPTQRSDDIHALRSAVAALQLINYLGPVSASEVARALGVSRAGAYRVLKTLAELGYVRPQRIGRAVHYGQTIRTRALSSGFVGDVRLLDVARPLMLAHTARHGFPLALSTPAGDHAFIRFNTDSATSRVLKRYRAGFLAPSVITAGGMLCLAHQSAALQEAVIERLGRTTIAAYAPAWDAAGLRAELERIRRDDYATYRWVGEREETLAVPLRWRGTVLAALVLRYMKVSQQLEPKLELLRGLASEIEVRLVAADAGPGTPATLRA